MDKLSKAGFTDIRGYLEGGLSEWLNAQEEIDMIIEIEADELAMDLPFDDELLVLDIRQQTEFAGGHVRDAMNMPLKTMNDPANMAMIEETCNIYIMGGSDMKQVMAAALLKRQGFHNLRTIEGGWESVLREKRIETVKEKEMLN
jgi:rhodanese-related sulfurtransferase